MQLVTQERGGDKKKVESGGLVESPIVDRSFVYSASVWTGTLCSGGRLRAVGSSTMTQSCILLCPWPGDRVLSKG